MIRVALVEDNGTIRGGLAQLIGGTEGFQCVAAYAGCEEMLREVTRLRPDVVLMDIVLRGGMSGIEGARRLKRLLPETTILMLTVYDDNDLIFDALCAGASGYLVKKTPPARLLEAIQEAHAGGAPMSSHIAGKVVGLLRSRGPGAAAAAEDPLTRRERAILTGLADGQTYQQLGETLHISTDTVRYHIRNVYRKLHAHSQSEAVAKALRRGII